MASEDSEMEVDGIDNDNDSPILSEKEIKTEKIDEDQEKEDDSLEDPDDDPIVKEIPVFLSKGLSKNLHLFQYPVRPCTLPYDPNTTLVMDSRMKPKQQKVELTLGLNSSCANYDQSKGEQIAINVDGSGRKPNLDDEMTYGRGFMDRITLSSSKSVKESSRYAVGIFNGSELHLTPLNGIVSLKPSLQYLDKSDRTARSEGRSKLNESSQDEDEDEETAKANAIQKVGVRFLKGGANNDWHQEMKKKSFDYQQKRAEEEAWVPMEYHHVKSDKWVETTSKLFCKHMDEVAIVGDTKIDQYLEELKKS